MDVNLSAVELGTGKGTVLALESQQERGKASFPQKFYVGERKGLDQ